MKYILVINQHAIVQNNLDLDMEDAAIIQFISDFTACDDAITRWKDGRVWAWVSWQLILTQLPMLRKRDSNGVWKPWKTDTVYCRIKQLVGRGFLFFEYENDKQWIALTSMGKQAIGIVKNAYTDTEKKQIKEVIQQEQEDDQAPMQTSTKSDLKRSRVGFGQAHISIIEDKKIDDKGREIAHVCEEQEEGQQVQVQQPASPPKPTPPVYPDFVKVDRAKASVTIFGITFTGDEAKQIKAKVDEGLQAMAENKEWYWWWDTYDVKVNQQRTEVLMMQNTADSERVRIVWHTAVFAHVTPQQYRPEPDKYLKNRRFMDEAILDRRDAPKPSAMTHENKLERGNLGGKTDIVPAV